MPKLPKSVGRSRAEPSPKKKSEREPKGNGKAPKGGDNGAALDAADFEHRQVGQAAGGDGAAMTATLELNKFERGLLSDLFAVIEEHTRDSEGDVDRVLIERAFLFACERHADQRRQSGEDFIVHPVSWAKICGGMQLDTATLFGSPE